MRRLLRRSLPLLAIASVAFAAETNPFIRDFDAVPTKATPTEDSGIALDSAHLPAPGSFQLSLLFDLNWNVMSLKLGDQKLGNLIPFRADQHLFAAYQLIPRLEIAADLPVTFYQQDHFSLLTEQGFAQPGIATAGLGDLRILPRVSIFQPQDFIVGLAIIPEVRFPTGDGASFLGDRAMVFAPRLAIERSFGPVRLIGNLGYRFRAPAQFLNLYVGQEFTFGAGAQLKLPDWNVLTNTVATAEMHLATPTEAPFNFAQADSLKTPWELLLGVKTHVASPRWMAELDVGRGLGLESGYGREDFRVLFKVSYVFEKPTGPDRDGDGVPDVDDKCPDVAGPASNGGCPDLDRDHDGVPNEEDLCPDQPGLKEYDGCPDRDGDQIPDNVDKCPDQPGPAENEGCPSEEPAVVLETNRIRIKNNILFETGSATIQRQSFKMLDEVYDVIAKHPEIGHVRIEGHTDNRGGRAYNVDLSNRRAHSVMEYLVKKGIAPKRLSAKGFGFEKPVASNATPLGRAKNRRVEFNLVDKADDSGAKEILDKDGSTVKQGATKMQMVQPQPDGGTMVTPITPGAADAGTAAPKKPFPRETDR